MTDGGNEFPASWFKKANLSPKGRDCSLNYFGVDASRPLSEWRKNGWIHLDDPRGWFQWYRRYYMGRRMPEEDQRQIKRWKAFRRHINQIKMNCEPDRSVIALDRCKYSAFVPMSVYVSSTAMRDQEAHRMFIKGHRHGSQSGTPYSRASI